MRGEHKLFGEGHSLDHPGTRAVTIFTVLHWCLSKPLLAPSVLQLHDTRRVGYSLRPGLRGGEV